MYSGHLFAISSFLQLSLALTLPLSTSWPGTSQNISVPVSLPYLNTTNYTTHGWPDHVPWALPIEGGLSLEFLSYGETLKPSYTKTIQEVLKLMTLKLNIEGKPTGNISDRRYQIGWVSLWIVPPSGSWPSLALVSRADILRVIQAIEGMFFILNWAPREFIADLKIQGQHQAIVMLSLRLQP